jgi:hypothetical protein
VDDDELKALLQEALAIAGGNMELVARVALKELVNRIVVIDDLQARITAIPHKRPVGRPRHKAGLGISEKQRRIKPLGAPNKMGLGKSTKDLAERAAQIKKEPVHVFDHEPTAEEIINMPPLTNKEAAARVLSIFDAAAASRDEKDIKNITKRMSEIN